MYKRIRELREDRDLFQRDIAKLLHTSQQHYSRIETGKAEITADRLIMLSEFYNVSIDYIVGCSDFKTLK